MFKHRHEVPKRQRPSRNGWGNDRIVLQSFLGTDTDSVFLSRAFPLIFPHATEHILHISPVDATRGKAELDALVL